MPYASHTIREGTPPAMQASGQYRGTVDVIDDSGSSYTFHLRAPDLASWNVKVASIPADFAEWEKEKDAREAVDFDSDPVSAGEANQARVAVAYIRRALQETECSDGFALLNRVNNYVTSNSDWPTVKPLLLAEGLTEKEYNNAAAAFQYLNTPERIAAMDAYPAIQYQWAKSR